MKYRLGMFFIFFLITARLFCMLQLHLQPFQLFTYLFKLLYRNEINAKWESDYLHSSLKTNKFNMNCKLLQCNKQTTAMQ